MTDPRTLNILVAEDNDISREMMIAVLKTRGYGTTGVIDGQEAIGAVKTGHVDLALVDINMVPLSGFQFVEYLVAQGIDVPVVIITADDSSDILMKASSLGAVQVIHKPIDPDRLLQAVSRVLKRRGIVPDPLAVEQHKTAVSPETLMKRALDLAVQNVRSGKGRPFGAVVADQEGHVLGEGTNGINSRVDPTAHAEVMAIRQASEKLGRADLSDCILYCSSEPTMMGKALVISVGIQKVYYGLSHEEIKSIRVDEQKVRHQIPEFKPGDADYARLCHDEAVEMYRKVQIGKLA